MKSLKTHIVLSFFVLIGYSLLGQNFNSKLRFEKLSAEVGFYKTGVNEIVEDYCGFLWMATWSGLARYDGYNVKIYRQEPDRANGLKSNKVTQIFEDSKNNLWIGTNYTGFYRFDRDNDRFIQYCKSPKDLNSLSNDNVLSIFEDSKGYIWIGTEQGLNRFNPKNGQFMHYLHSPTDNRTINHNYIYSISETPDGSLWVGTQKGLNRFIQKGNEAYFVTYNLIPKQEEQNNSYDHDFVFKVIPSRYNDNVLWICNNVSLKRVTFDPKNLNEFSIEFWKSDKNDINSLSHSFVSDMWEEDEKNVWVATYDCLNFLNIETGKNQVFVSKPNDIHSISDNVVSSLFKDRTGNLWIGMDKGLNKLNLDNKTFQNIKLSTKDNTNSISCLLNSETKSGLGAGSRGGGLNFFPVDENGNFNSKPFNYTFPQKDGSLLYNFVTDIILDEKQRLWIATDGAGIYRINESDIPNEDSEISNFVQFDVFNQLKHNYVQSLLRSSTEDLWLGYWDEGIARYDIHTGTFHHYTTSKSLSVNFEQYPIVHLFETIENKKPILWAGTRGGGILKLSFEEENNQIIVLDKYTYVTGAAGELSNNHINSFYQSQNGALWIATDNGLNRLDSSTGKFQSFYEKNGLGNSLVQSIIEDDNENIWISTQQGISLIEREDKDIEVRNFNLYDGLDDTFFNDDAAVKTGAKQLAFGGANGLSIFNPTEIKYDSIAPKVIISNLKLANKTVPIGEIENGRTILTKSIEQTKSLNLSHTDNIVSLEFKGLHLDEPKQIKYAYTLEGFNSDWIYTDASQRIATYTNLPYSDFTFKVKAANGDGVWSKPIELKLSITPPFAQSKIAYLLYTLGILGLIYLGIWFTKLRAEDKHKLALERIEKDNLQEVNKLKLQFFTNLSHELRTPLTLITSPLDQLVQNATDPKKKRVFNRMRQNANRLLSMINQLLDIRKNEAGLMNLHVSKGDIAKFGNDITSSFGSLAQQRDINLVFNSNPNYIEAWFDHGQMEKVFFNLLSNAFKFTKDGGKIDINIQKKTLIEIRVTDTGFGIPKAQLKNIFERFYQVENKPKWSRKSGTGIGLSLAKMIVEKHHGTIEAQSTEGVGTQFKILIPAKKESYTKKELMNFDSEVEHFSRTNNGFNPELLATEKTVSAPILELNTTSVRPSILLVEDNSDIRSYLKENLEQTYEIFEATDGKEGFDKASAAPPSLIIADIAMPRMDGIEMCTKIKSTIATSHVPVILLTARTSLAFQMSGLETGADDYISKPFNMQLLIARVNNIIQSRKKLQEQLSNNANLSPTEVTINSLDDKLLKDVKLIIERHIDNSKFSVAKLAEQLNMTRLQLYRKLTALTGQSPNQIIRSFRMKRAAQLLTSGKYNVSDVTYMVGYNDLKSFRQQFKKEYGVSPSSYIKRK